jgi:ATP-dependent DNA helicase RecQ
VDQLRQVRAVLDRHKGETGIIYCIRRADVDGMCAQLNHLGYSALPYHAGMEGEDRKANQEAFVTEKVETIVATIAFGMGIDKSNVRYVIHAAMPKSLEHYQQESGRAGRDGLEAECCVCYSGSDYQLWKRILSDMEPDAQKIALAKLGAMLDYCAGVTCRHRAILDYFGQDLGKDNCRACDVCLGDLDSMEDALETAQKILSCVLRLREGYGAEYTTLVLIGSEEERILNSGHDALSTYGLLSDHPGRVVRDWVEQLVAQGCIGKTGQYNVLKVTEKGWRVLKGHEEPRLLKPAKKKARRPKALTDSWEGVEEGLFEALRELRRELADRKRVPAFVVFGDRSLRDMARRRPSSPSGFLQVHGVGEAKSRRYGTVFLDAIRKYCLANSLEMDAV